MSINLIKNDKINLSKNKDNTTNNLSQMIIGLGWDVMKGQGDYDLDACALLLKNDVLESIDDIVSYQKKQHKSGTVWSCGDNLTGEGDGDDEQLVVKLDSIPSEYNKIVVYATIYQGRSRGQELAKVENAFIRAVDANNKEIAKYNISGNSAVSGHCSLVFAEIERTGNTWEFKAIGESFKTDSLNEVADSYMQKKKLFGMF